MPVQVAPDFGELSTKLLLMIPINQNEPRNIPLNGPFVHKVNSVNQSQLLLLTFQLTSPRSPANCPDADPLARKAGLAIGQSLIKRNGWKPPLYSFRHPASAHSSHLKAHKQG